jgi:hypothetical protein
MDATPLLPVFILPRSTWAARADPTAYLAGTIQPITDYGMAGSWWVTDGVRWYAFNGVLSLLQTAFPMILPSSGTIGNNGALSGLTALPVAYTSCYMWFPANAIVAGSAAGMYYVVMSSTTAGTIKNNTYTFGQPNIPASPIAFSTTGPGAYTQTTNADITLLSVNVLANSMGISGGLLPMVLCLNNNSVGNKIHKYKLGSFQIASTTNTTTTFLQFATSASMYNAGVANAQRAQFVAGYGAVDTTQNQTISITAQLAVATDYAFVSTATLLLETP